MTSQLPPYIQAFSGSVGSAVANGLTYPLDLVTTRVQTSESAKDVQGPSGALRILKKSIHKHGLISLYDGLPTDMAATLFSNFFYFYFYSFLRSSITNHRARTAAAIKGRAAVAAHTALAVLEELGAGFVAAVASRAISTPLSLVTVQLQSQSDSDDESESVGDVVKRIHAEAGLKGFWNGFSATVMLSMNPALTLLMFQVYRKFVLRGSTPGPAQSFIGAATSNALAVTILYPLILAKTRLQSYRNAPPPLILPNAGEPTFASAVKTTKEHSILPPRTKTIPQNVPAVIRSIVKTNGVKGLYQGLEAQVLKGFLSQGVTMLAKERIESMIVALYVRHMLGASAAST